MRFQSAPLLVNGSMSGNLFSHGIDLQQAWIYSIQANYSGNNDGTSVAGAGTMKLQVSDDNPAFQLSGPVSSADPAAYVTNWTDYSGSLSSTSSVLGSSSFLWNVLYPGYRWVRFAYVAASGSGNMSVNYNGKSN